jgi:hypothetical protein
MADDGIKMGDERASQIDTHQTWQQARWQYKSVQRDRIFDMSGKRWSGQ